MLKQACTVYLEGLGIPVKTARRAFAKAVAAQRAYKQAVQAMAAVVLAEAESEDRPVAVIVGRPYHLDPLLNHNVPQILADLGMDVIPEDALPLAAGATLGDAHVLTQWEYHNRDYYAARWVARHENAELVQLNSFGCGPDAIAVDEVRRILREYGKCHTVIRVDEMASTGSVKLRLRSLVESLQRPTTGTRPAFRPSRKPRPFQAADRAKTIIVPEFSHFTTAPFTRPMLDLDYRIEYLPSPDRQAVEVGLKYTNNEICYPAVLVVGQLIAALQSGQYDPDDVVIAISQTGGQCRASCYLSLIKRALVAADLERVPVISVSLNPKALNEQPGFKLNIVRYSYKAALGLFYADSLATLYHATAVREVEQGQALRLADCYLADLADGSLPLTRSAMLETLRRAVADFNAIETVERAFPVVGVVGEIYVRYNSFSNHQVVQWLMTQGIEVISPPLQEFFLGWLVGPPAAVAMKIKRRDRHWLLVKVLRGYVDGLVADVDAVMASFRHYRSTHSIYDLAHKAESIVSLANQYGEGWLLPGEICALAEDGVQNVLCLQPFGCLPNHVVAKGVETRIRERYPHLNLLMLDTDAGLSEVNYFNRLHFFVEQARRTAPM